MKRTIRFVVIIWVWICGVTATGITAVSPLEVPPPISEKLLTDVQDAVHPFLMATRDQFRQARRLWHDDLYYPRWKEYKQRVEGYTDDTSPWYIGKGPLNQDASFHPQFLNDNDLRLYSDVLCERLAYIGIESERWAINQIREEFIRLLDDLSANRSSAGQASWAARKFTVQEAQLTALMSLMFDMVYNRIDTADRHEPARKFKAVRDQLADYCALLNPGAVSPRERVVLGSGLGLSTLMCAAIYPNEWAREKTFSAQSYLPDLYRAVTLTRSGLDDMITEDLRIRQPLAEIESTLLVAIPWIECMKRFGYPLVVTRGTYDRCYQALTKHRLPQSTEILSPFLRLPLRDPWIPKTETLLWPTDPAMYKDDDEAAPAVASVTDELRASGLDINQVTTVIRTEKSASQKSRGLPERMVKKENDRFRLRGRASRSINVKPNISLPTPIPLRSSGTRPGPNLREMLEKLSFPRRESTEVVTEPTEEIRLEAGWTRPVGLELPPCWGGLIQLAAAENPASGAQELWDEFGTEIDSHPYTFVYQKPVRSTKADKDDRAVLLQYPEEKMTVLNTANNRFSYHFASQASKATHPMATYTIDHESFLLNEDGLLWRWMHEASVETRSVSAETVVETTTTEPINTDLFTWWSSFSPRGRTEMIHKNWGGVGGSFTVVAHYPSEQSFTHVVFKTPEGGKYEANPEVPDWLKIRTSDSDELHNTMDYQVWQQIQRAQRRGQINPIKAGELNVLFSPGAMRDVGEFDGVLGTVVDASLNQSNEPFFYIVTTDQSEHEMFTSKYASIPIDGLRVLEWKQGIDLVAINGGKELSNPFIHTDAKLALVSFDKEMRGLFYIMIDGTFLRAKFSPNQSTYTLLVDTKGKRLNAAWSTRRLHVSEPPNSMASFYAPNALGFECPGTVIEYGQRGRQLTVWGHKDKDERR